MIAQIGNIVIGKLTTLPFIDKYAGVIKPITYIDKAAKGGSIRKTFPADCQITFDQCSTGRYKDLCLDDSKKSVLYLEDTGLQLTKQEGNYMYFTANMDLVCWLNIPKLGYSDCSYSGIAIASIIASLPHRPFNQDIYHRVNIQMVSQKPKNQNPFAKYSYDEATTQFLMYPYDYFVLSLKIDFVVDIRCVEITALNNPIACLNK